MACTEFGRQLTYTPSMFQRFQPLYHIVRQCSIERAAIQCCICCNIGYDCYLQIFGGLFDVVLHVPAEITFVVVALILNWAKKVIFFSFISWWKSIQDLHRLPFRLARTSPFGTLSTSLCFVYTQIDSSWKEYAPKNRLFMEATTPIYWNIYTKIWNYSILFGWWRCFHLTFDSVRCACESKVKFLCSASVARCATLQQW